MMKIRNVISIILITLGWLALILWIAWSDWKDFSAAIEKFKDVFFNVLTGFTGVIVIIGFIMGGVLIWKD